MDLYLGSPHRYIKRMGLGYALSHEMNGNTTIEIYKSLNKLILDNGADELGEGQGGFRLAYLAGKLNPDWIILPDVLHKDKKTRQCGIDFYSQMIDTGYTGKFMSVIQAKTLEKGLGSYAFWDSSGIVSRIGVTYDTMIETELAKELPSYGKRLGFLEYLANSSAYTNGNGTGIHMLGTLDVEELYYLKRDHYFENANRIVESHDTTAPYACNTHFEVEEECIRFGRAKDWPRLNFNATFSMEREETMHWNVACYLAACKIPFEKWDQYLSPANATYYYDDKGLSAYY